MLKKHKVNFVSGIIWSNVMLAVAPTVTGAGTIMVGTNAGPHELSGKMCNELYFTTSWQNDQTPEAMGKYMQDQGLTDVYAMAPNYAAGKDMVNGFKRYFKGRVVDEVYTKLGQQDYQAEISQLRGKSPKAVFVFYPGDMGIQFLKQYAQAGLREQIPLYSVYTVDEISLPAVGEAALGKLRDTLLESRSQERGEREVRRRLQEEVRLHAVVLRRPELRRHLADRLVRARGQGRPRQQEGHGRGHAQGRLPLHARQVHVQRQSHPDPELLPAAGAEGYQRGDRDADPEDGLREPQGRLLPRVSDEMVGVLAR